MVHVPIFLFYCFMNAVLCYPYRVVRNGDLLCDKFNDPLEKVDDDFSS